MATTTAQDRSRSDELPASPLSLSASDWRATLKDTGKEVKADRVPITAAGMAFYWLLAIFPALIAAIGVLGLLDLAGSTRRTLADAIRQVLPGGAADVLVQAVTNTGGASQAASLTATLVGLGVALWSASSGMAALQVGLDVAYDVEQDRSFLAKRGVAFLLMGVTLVLGGIATVLLVFGVPLADALRDALPLGSAFGPAFAVARWVLTLAAVSVLFGAFYHLGPNRSAPRWTWITPGGVLAMVVWVAASLGFSFYVNSFGSYAETYGSFAGIVVLVLWLFLTALAVLLGAELNGVLEKRGRRSGSISQRTSA